MPQEMSVSELRRIAGLHKGLTPESWLMGWAADEIERLESVVIDMRNLLDEARSGYIPGCGEDERWQARKDESMGSNV
ncbi:MAG: hypothetical protein NTY41_10425 [Proteobacteria bacterium]|nr:hypothetical protein [Pseudomonadota bacterium]